jgi:hypothetical protein
LCALDRACELDARGDADLAGYVPQVRLDGLPAEEQLVRDLRVGLAVVLLAISMLTDPKARALPLDWRSAAWLWPYLVGMVSISYLNSFDTRTASSIPLIGLDGPRNTHTFGWDILAVAVLSLAVYALAIRSRLPTERSLAYIGDLTAETEADNGLAIADSAGSVGSNPPGRHPAPVGGLKPAARITAGSSSASREGTVACCPSAGGVSSSRRDTAKRARRITKACS